ncbi:hypothetical protein B9Z19DRAFT_1065171 [Tuber borchii]|uniref:Uncharacterized protein n=1 Tax=Tuber borchii TaxID=42251 RepID=A0A2T6ZS63_TUBBO|nr:hypothetical protein B9Z19DRAFT_1065171 [Tuber borchii]
MIETWGKAIGLSINGEEKTSIVFQSQELQMQLVEVIETFFAQAHSRQYQQRIPANKTPVRAFEFSKATTLFYHSQVSRSSGCGSGSESEIRGRAGQKRKRKEKEKTRKKYTYTVIFREPEGAKARIMTREEVIKANKYLDPKVEKADIGPSSFYNTVKEARDRKEKNWSAGTASSKEEVNAEIVVSI